MPELREREAGLVCWALCFLIIEAFDQLTPPRHVGGMYPYDMLLCNIPAKRNIKLLFNQQVQRRWREVLLGALW